jgi:hypothetical protein
MPKTHAVGGSRPNPTLPGSTGLGVALPASVAGAVVEPAAGKRERAQTCFVWSHAKLRIAGLALLVAGMPAVAGFALSTPVGRWLSVAWLAAIAFVMHGLSRRVCDHASVLLVDQRGIFDRRLMPRPIAWHEIAAIYPVDTDRARVVDIALRWPKITLGKTRWSIRIGAYCQTGYNVPAVSISLLLLEGNVSQFLQAVAQYRPDLLHYSNRGALVERQS